MSRLSTQNRGKGKNADQGNIIQSLLNILKADLRSLSITKTDFLQKQTRKNVTLLIIKLLSFMSVKDQL